MKMPMIERGLAPSVRRMAMSARLSVTVITSVETRLKAATATISVRMMNIRRFSICTASNQLRLVRVQSRTAAGGRATLRQLRRPTPRASCTSFRRSCTPVGPSTRNRLRRVVQVHQRQRAVVLVVAGLEGADHGELLQPRHHAGRRDLAAGRDHRDLVALAHAERARQLDAEHDAPGAGLQPRERAAAQLRGQRR